MGVGEAYDALVVEGISKKGILEKMMPFLLRLDQNWIFCFVRIRGISIGSVYFTGREDFSIVFSIF